MTIPLTTTHAKVLVAIKEKKTYVILTSYKECHEI
jgi:hypothetical protein